MKFKPTIAGEASGSIGALTFSHNRGGAYIRNRVVPTNPNTSQQQAVRGIMGQLTSDWLDTLTDVQRAAWDNYALQVPLLDTLGEPRNAGGIGMYIRGNSARIQAGLARVDAGPTIYNLGAYTDPVPAQPSAAGGDMDVAFTTGDAWVSEDGASMLVYCSRGVNASINYFKGPYRLAGQIDGDSGTPPTSPATITLPFPVAAGQRMYVKINVTRADGRYSSTFRTGVVVAA